MFVEKTGEAALIFRGHAFEQRTQSSYDYDVPNSIVFILAKDGVLQ